MSEGVIRFDHVWKKFMKGERHTSLRDLIPSMGRSLVARRNSEELQRQEFWAVRDVSFAVKPGEALGIIGPNGAGKSTSLKLLTKVMRPTRGQCSIQGRVGALIEVAAGFQPDLTGRENVFLQGAIMGMKRADISRRLDDIVDFSGLHDFMDTQVKRYSSGMNARLGFSIAANLEPDALVIDEVLAVGDMAFQQRCIERMLDFKKAGVAIAFVSHNLRSVALLCDRAVLLNHAVTTAGAPADVIRAYTAGTQRVADTERMDPVKITGAELLDDRGFKLEGLVAPGALLTLRVHFLPSEPVDDPICDFLLYRASDSMLAYEGHFALRSAGLASVASREQFRIDFRFRANLGSGDYRVVARLRDSIMRRFLADGCPPNFFTVAGTPHMDRLAHLALLPIPVAAAPAGA